MRHGLLLDAKLLRPLLNATLLHGPGRRLPGLVADDNGELRLEKILGTHLLAGELLVDVLDGGTNIFPICRLVKGNVIVGEDLVFIIISDHSQAQIAGLFRAFVHGAARSEGVVALVFSVLVVKGVVPMTLDVLVVKGFVDLGLFGIVSTHGRI